MKTLSQNTHLFDGWSLPIMVLDRELCFTYANEAYLDAVHKTLADIRGLYVFDAFPDSQERIDVFHSKFLETLDGAVTKLDAQPFQVNLGDGTFEDRVWQTTQDPLRNANGEIIGLIQRCEDITQRHALETRMQAIGHELSHRVKNIMAVVSSVARITGRNYSNVSEFVENFTARLNAMSRTNDLLSQGDWNGLDIKTIFENELSPYLVDDAPSYTLNGPLIRLSNDASKDLSMVCHELATNAVKYGCLGKPGGTLTATWSRKDEQVTIHWQETCPDNITVSDRIGFGTRLFDMLPYATVERDFTPTGLHLTITMDGEKVFA